MRRYEIVVTDITPTSYDITVWRIEDGVRSEAAGEPCWYTGDLEAAVTERLARFEYRLLGPWREQGGTLVADVEPVVR